MSYNSELFFRNKDVVDRVVSRIVPEHREDVVQGFYLKLISSKDLSTYQIRNEQGFITIAIRNYVNSFMTRSRKDFSSDNIEIVSYITPEDVSSYLSLIRAARNNLRKVLNKKTFNVCMDILKTGDLEEAASRNNISYTNAKVIKHKYLKNSLTHLGFIDNIIEDRIMFNVQDKDNG